jgi:hypothetical protein
MPARSKAQFKMMFVLRKKGQITDKQLDDFTGPSTHYKDLPDHVQTRKDPCA